MYFNGRNFASKKVAKLLDLSSWIKDLAKFHRIHFLELERIMTQTDRVYTSDRNGDTAKESINIDMLKMLKDKIAFLRSELSRELRSN